MAETAPSSTPGVLIDAATGKKTFIPLENNPSVMSGLAIRLGMSPSLDFYDVFSIDSPELLAMVPRPVHGLILIAPSPIYSRVRSKYDGPEGITYDGYGPAEPVIWFEQTIGHACGLYSLVHALGNGSAAPFVGAGSLLDGLLQAARPLRREERARVLYDSAALERAHMASATKGDSTVPSAAEPVGYHFITFVRGTDGHLWELEGAWDPIDRGGLDEGEDCLSERALELGVGKYLREATDGNLELSIVALATKPEHET